MNRLQKKCLIATTGFHLLLVLVVVFGSAFFVSHSKPDESQILTVISSTVVDAAFNSGMQSAQPPPPSPVQPPQPVQPTPQPPAPQPEPPKQTIIEKVQEIFKPEPPKLEPNELNPVEPADKPTKPAPKKPQISLVPVVRKVSKPTTDTSEADERREAQRVRDQKARAFRSAMSSISEKSSTATEVSMPGPGTAAYTNFKDALATIYYNAWTPPDDVTNDDAITKVRITIARDGSIISARIIGPSGDSRVDASVQRAIDRVTEVPPLPDAKESQRTVTLNFNLKTKRLIG
jgi:TonB family protein